MANKRDNGYYEARLKSEHPAAFQDLQDGKHRTLADALVAVGLRRPRTPLHELRNAWRKANPTERSTFLADIGHAVPAPSPAPSAPRPALAGAPVAVFSGGRFTPAGKGAMHRLLADPDIKGRMGAVMKVIGRSPNDQSLSMALSRDTLVKAAVAADIETLLSDRGHLL